MTDQRMTFAPDQCPGCGRPNQCALDSAVNTEEAPHCWCFEVTIDAAALKRLPCIARNQGCLCPSCATGAIEGIEGDTTRAAENKENGG